MHYRNLQGNSLASINLAPLFQLTVILNLDVSGNMLTTIDRSVLPLLNNMPLESSVIDISNNPVAFMGSDVLGNGAVGFTFFCDGAVSPCPGKAS